MGKYSVIFHKINQPKKVDEVSKVSLDEGVYVFRNSENKVVFAASAKDVHYLEKVE